jgi:hypothetical protein
MADTTSSVEISQHEFRAIEDKPPYQHEEKHREGTLGLALVGYREQERKVLDFWRSNGQWVFKLMALR